MQLATYDPAEDPASDTAIATFMAEAFATEDLGYSGHAPGVGARAKGMARIAERTDLSLEQLYRSRNEHGNPTLKTTMTAMASAGKAGYPPPPNPETVSMPRPALLACVLLTGLVAALAPGRATAAAPEANAPYLPGFHAATAPPAPTPPAPAPTPPAPTPPAPARAAPVPAAPATPVTASDYMAVAAQAVAQQQAKPALRALGRAETRLISRSVPLFQTNRPSADPAVSLIDQARQAVRAGDFTAAAGLIQRATPLVARQLAHPPPAPPVGLPTH